MSSDDEPTMKLTDDELRAFKAIAWVRKHVLIPLQALLIVLKLLGRIDASWLLVLIPGALYLVLPMILGALGPYLQHRRYRKRT